MYIRSIRRHRRRETSPTKDGTSASASDITWNGKTYSYNEHLSNFLFLGIDTKEKAETKTGQADAGQADALYLLSWNRLEGDITVISIPRDTMTQIETFGPGGKSLGKSKDHISLSYAYGDGGYESCELAENAVSELLYGLPIDGYCALNMDGLPVLTDSVGGVTVTVPNDSLAEVDPGYAKGAVVTLKGEDIMNSLFDTEIRVQPERDRTYGAASRNISEHSAKL